MCHFQLNSTEYIMCYCLLYNFLFNKSSDISESVFRLCLFSSLEKDLKYPSMAMLAMKTPMEERRLKTPCMTVISSPQTSWPTSLNSQSAQSAQPYSHCFSTGKRSSTYKTHTLFLFYVFTKSPNEVLTKIRISEWHLSLINTVLSVLIQIHMFRKRRSPWILNAQ